MSGSRTLSSTFVNSPLVSWLKTFNDDKNKCHQVVTDFKQICDEHLLQKIWQQIDPNPPYSLQALHAKHQTLNISQDDVDEGISSTIHSNESLSSLLQTPFNSPLCRLQSLIILLLNIRSYYEESLGQLLVLPMPDVVKIARNNTDESSLDEINSLLLLLLGAAVQCNEKEKFIERIKLMDLDTQHDIVECIQVIHDNPSSVWMKNEWSQLNILPLDEKETMYSLLVQHVTKLVKERDELYIKMSDLVFQLESFYQTYPGHMSALSWSSSCSVTQISEKGSESMSPRSLDRVVSPTRSESVPVINQQKSQLMMEISEIKSKLRRTQDDLEEKNELISEMKEMLELSKESCNKLRQENLDLIQEVRSSKAYRDEIDILTERVRKIDSLESEVQSYKDKINELNFYKSRVEEVKEDNRILSETKSMLEDQLNISRKRVDMVPDLEGQLLQLKAYSDELKASKDVERTRVTSLMDEVSQLQVEKKGIIEELAQKQAEIDSLTSQLTSESLKQSGQSNLLEQLNNDAAKRLLKLELENQKLQSLLDQRKSNQQKSQLMVEMVKTKLRRMQQDVDEKNVLITEMKDKLDCNTDSCNKLRQENAELRKEVRTLTANQEEIGILRDRVKIVDSLESEIQSCNDKIKELNYYKVKAGEMEEKNRILSETKSVLEEQLSISQKQSNLIQDLEEQLSELKIYSNNLSTTADGEREKIATLMNEVVQIQQEKKAVVEELGHTQTEMKDLKTRLNKLTIEQTKSNLLNYHSFADQRKSNKGFGVNGTNPIIEDPGTRINTGEKLNKRLSSTSADDSNVYGRIWEAGSTMPLSNTAVLLPIRNTSSSGNLSQDTNFIKDYDDDLKKKSHCNSDIPPRLPPRSQTTTINNRMTISITANQPTSPSRDLVEANPASPNDETQIRGSANSFYSNSGSSFIRGQFGSRSVNYGSMHRHCHLFRDPTTAPMRNGHVHHHHHLVHHIHPFHHHHHHSASHSVRSDSSLTPVEDLELNDCPHLAIEDTTNHSPSYSEENHEFNINENDINETNHDGNDPASINSTTSIWYEYGCV